LKAERKLRNLSLEEIARVTKIKEDLLKAIEEGRYEFLPPAIYVKGFLTIYARYLGFDPHDVVQPSQKYIEERKEVLLAYRGKVEKKENKEELKKAFPPLHTFKRERIGK